MEIPEINKIKTASHPESKASDALTDKIIEVANILKKATKAEKEFSYSKEVPPSAQKARKIKPS